MTNDRARTGLVLDENPTFLGNTTLCDDPSFARTVLLDQADMSQRFSFWNAWISSGILAPFLVKLTVTNFGIVQSFALSTLCQFAVEDMSARLESTTTWAAHLNFAH